MLIQTILSEPIAEVLCASSMPAPQEVPEVICTSSLPAPQEDLMMQLAKYEELRIASELQGLTSMVKNACKRMAYDCKFCQLVHVLLSIQ